MRPARVSSTRTLDFSVEQVDDLRAELPPPAGVRAAVPRRPARRRPPTGRSPMTRRCSGRTAKPVPRLGRPRRGRARTRTWSPRYGTRLGAWQGCSAGVARVVARLLSVRRLTGSGRPNARACSGPPAEPCTSSPRRLSAATVSVATATARLNMMSSWGSASGHRPPAHLDAGVACVQALLDLGQQATVFIEQVAPAARRYPAEELARLGAGDPGRVRVVHRS